MRKEVFYGGADYGLDPKYVSTPYSGFIGYRVDASQVGFPSDPRTANQVQAVTSKMNTGTKVVEVSGVEISGAGHLDLMNSIPKQQFDEIRRLKQLTGTELSFHAPLIELSGVDSRSGLWEEVERQKSEREMIYSIEQGRRLMNDKDEKNKKIPIVFHTTNFGVQMETKYKGKDGKEVVTEAIIINKATGQPQRFRLPNTPDYLGEGKPENIQKAIEKQNEEAWLKQLQQVNYSAEQATRAMHNTLKEISKDNKNVGEILEVYKAHKSKENIEKPLPAELREAFRERLQDIRFGDVYIRDTYKNFKELFNQAYATAEQQKDKENIAKLDEFRKKVSPHIAQLDKDPVKIAQLGETLLEGLDVLTRIKPPQTFTPMNDFMIEKASETIAKAAAKSYAKFGEGTPIIALENPPAEKFPLSRAEDIIKLVDESRKKFVAQVTKPKNAGGLGLSEKEAAQKAADVIGVTWDTGHINSMQAFGYDRKDVIKQAELIAPYVKHVHVVDNFGLSDTELPAGMGTAPIKETLALIDKENKNVKKIMETGAWYSKMQMRNTPVLESLSGLGSPIYAARMSPYWDQAARTYGGYWSGLGPINPPKHHELYGAGFSNLPVDLGGNMEGQNRLSGTPTE